MREDTAGRLYGADFIRAAACLTVLCHHLAQRMSWSQDLGVIDGFRIFSRIGTFGVAMFFVLSGFLLARPFWAALDAGAPMPSLRTYAKRRAARILPGFWLALIVTFILSFTVFGATLDRELVIRFLAGFFLVADWHWLTFFPVEINGPLWSISFEVTSYVLLPFAFAAVFALRGLIGGGWAARAAWIGVLAAVLVAHQLFVWFYPIDNVRRGWDFGLVGGAKWWMPRYNPFALFAMFAIGALAGGVQVSLARVRTWLFDVLALGAFGLVIWLFIVQGRGNDDSGFGWLGIPYGFPWFVLAIGAVLAVTPSSLAVGPVLDNAVVRYIARISFGIYVWHYVMLELVRRFFVPDMTGGNMVDAGGFVLASLVVAGLSAVVAHASFYLLERPFIRWAQGSRPSQAAAPTLSPAAG